MARLAHQFAIVNAHITADVVDLALFPELGQRYQIFATPALVINDQQPVFGFLRADELAQHVLHVAGPRPFEDA